MDMVYPTAPSLLNVLDLDLTILFDEESSAIEASSIKIVTLLHEHRSSHSEVQDFGFWLNLGAGSPYCSL